MGTNQPAALLATLPGLPGEGKQFQDLTYKTWQPLQLRSPAKAGIDEAPQIGLHGAADRWFPTAFLA